jgi:hypothetical protein
MAFDDDLPLDRPTPETSPYAPSPEPEPDRGSWLRWIAVGLAGVVAGGLLTFWWMSRAQPTPAAAPSATAPEAATSVRPTRQSLNLPTLNNSDSFIQELVSLLSGHPTLARLLATPAIVRETTAGVVQIGDGRTPITWLKVLRPAARLQILGTTSGPVSPVSHARWNQVAAAVSSVSPTDAAQLYVNVKPLIDEAYIELGQPDGDFDQAILRAVRMLEETPTPEVAPELVQRPGYFDYEDPAFRALKPVQKQLLLLGPDNRRQLMDWLDQFVRALGLR